ncbi:lipase family protein [Mesorhizobium sp. KR9-304]|uniref:lipase family protein n=1 Tax=Mesorhizobium sp. KR9-304 TaxID=3156614 RepID=UPI0032B320BB
MRSRLELSAIVVVCLMTLTACIGVSRQELLLLGSTVTPAKVDFVELGAYASRSKAAYATEAAIRSKYPATVRVGSPGKTDAQYFLEQDDKAKVQYIAIRGTANRRNLIEDVEMRIREDLALAIPVHAGFDGTARVLYADMTPSLKRDYTTYITGHSLGGALAALLAIHMIEDGYKVDKVVTFGQPKFTTTDGVAKLGFLKLTRVVDENDMVPMLPPTTIVNRLYGVYEHAGPEIILLDGPHYVFLPTHDAGRISIGEFGRSLNIADLKDHHMDNYLSRLAAKSGGAVAVSYDEREKYVAPKKKVASN